MPLKEAGSGLGSGGFIVYDEDVCMVKVAYTYSWFLSLESCGQCLSCKHGCDEITKHLKNLESEAGSEEDLEEIKNQLGMIENGKRCFLASEERFLIQSLCRRYWDEFLSHIGKPCPFSREAGLPKMEDFDETKRQFLYDTAYAGKALVP